MYREFFREILPLETPPMDWHVRTYVTVQSTKLEQAVITSMTGGTILAAHLALKGVDFWVEDTQQRELLRFSPDKGFHGLRWFFDGVEQAVECFKTMNEMNKDIKDPLQP